MNENECSFISHGKDENKKANEILKCVSKLKEIADELYKNGCEPEDVIVYTLKSYIQGIETLCK